jgi:dolichol-phosphate mannosyltransferase
MSELRLSVIIPAHNEEETLPRTILTVEWALREASVPHEIVVVDDHSSDGTAGVVTRLQEQCRSLRLVSNERARGFGNAVHTGMDSFEGDAMCVVMADGSDDPDDIVRYYRKLEEGHECVFGSRFMPGSTVSNYPKHKFILNRLVNLFIRLLFGIDYNDVTNAFKCYRRNVTEGIKPILSHHFNLTVELPLKAIVRGYSYAVVPIHWYGRTHGISKLRLREMGSRYLFIVLYIFLERRLAGEDYRRSGSPAMVGSAMPAQGTARLGWAWLGFAVAAISHLLFFYTYPLNHLGGDTVGYYYVLTNRISNLLFAPGYPVAFSLPLRWDFLNRLANAHPAAFRSTLLFTQHAMELAALALLLVVLARTYNRLTAALGVAIAGYSPRAMGVTSSVYPEWLQGSLAMTSYCLAALAFHTPSRLRKTILYSAAFVTFAWCILVKFNAVPFGAGLLLFFLFEKASWRERAKMFAVSFGSAFVFYSVFVLWFHKPYTGTFALTRDRSWVLMTRLFLTYGNRLPYPQGIASKRWLAMNELLPKDYSVASVGIFLSDDVVPKEVRAVGKKVKYLMTADEKVVDQVLRTHHLPEGFHISMSFLPISYFVGLKESDDLGVTVFRESVLHDPVPYLRGIWHDSVSSLRFANTEPLYPTAEMFDGVTEKLIPIGGNMLRMERLPASQLPYDSSEPFIWAPGLRLFSSIGNLALTRSHCVTLMALGFLLALWHGFRYGWSFRSAVPVALALLLWGFVVFSNARNGGSPI